jgi:hypothetical protein
VEIEFLEKASAMYCPRCGTKIVLDANFCYRCGQPLNEIASKETEIKNENITERRIRTGGGAFIEGNVGTESGAVVGRDLHAGRSFILHLKKPGEYIIRFSGLVVLIAAIISGSLYFQNSEFRSTVHRTLSEIRDRIEAYSLSPTATPTATPIATPAATPTATSTATPAATPTSILAATPDLRTAEEQAVVCIIEQKASGTPAKVLIDSLRYSSSASGFQMQELPLTGGQQIPFSSMKSFEVLAANKEALSGVTVAITLVSGDVITGVVEHSQWDATSLTGTTEFGSFELRFLDVKQVSFEQGSCQ